MSREFPDFIEPWRAADGARQIAGTLPLARLKRLVPLLALENGGKAEGEVTFGLEFGYDPQRRACVEVEVSAQLPLMCQRSLKPYTESISQHSVLVIISEASEQQLLSDDEEFLLVDEGRLAVADLVEDELLLAIPQVPRNPEVDAVIATTATGDELDDQGGLEADHGATSAKESGERQRPFEGLADMMKQK